VKETFSRREQNLVRQQANHNDREHDFEDLIHCVEFAAVMKQIAKPEPRGRCSVARSDLT
jgi:hypothetical protein